MQRKGAFINNPIQNRKIAFLLALGILSIFHSGCAANPNSTSKATIPTETSVTAQNNAAAAMVSAHVTFNYSDYYSLNTPNPTTGCAGDANSFYDAFAVNST